jgi:hypothetical protein
MTGFMKSLWQDEFGKGLTRADFAGRRRRPRVHNGTSVDEIRPTALPSDATNPYRNYMCPSFHPLPATGHAHCRSTESRRSA